MGVGVNVDISRMKLFLTGSIFSKKTCSSSETNHALLLIGFNKKEWVFKNSWGGSNNPYVTVKIIKEFPIYKNHRCFCGGTSYLCSADYLSNDYV